MISGIATFYSFYHVVVKASDQSSLEAFQRWVERTTFIPRPNMHVRVKVSSGAATVPTRACADCVSKWEGSRVLEVKKMINWANKLLTEELGSDWSHEMVT